MRAALVALLAALGCGGGDGAPIEVPVRRPTAGEPLLALAPAGADAVLEIDLARVRANPTVGRLARAIAPTSDGAELGRLDAVLVASYGLGDGAPRMLVLGRGGEVDRLTGAAPIAPDAVALGDAGLIRRAHAVAGGHEPALATDRALLRLRAEAMPAAAEAAAFRLTARLSFEARVALARRLSLDTAPRTISLWADVIDDLALIARVDGDPGEGARLEKQGRALVARLAEGAPIYGRALARELGRIRVDGRGGGVRFTLVIGPRRLAALVAGALRLLEPASRGTLPGT